MMSKLIEEIIPNIYVKSLVVVCPRLIIYVD